jgi:hypothetical protein
LGPLLQDGAGKCWGPVLGFMCVAYEGSNKVCRLKWSCFSFIYLYSQSKLRRVTQSSAGILSISTAPKWFLSECLRRLLLCCVRF